MNTEQKISSAGKSPGLRKTPEIFRELMVKYGLYDANTTGSFQDSGRVRDRVSAGSGEKPEPDFRQSEKGNLRPNQRDRKRAAMYKRGV